MNGERRKVVVVGAGSGIGAAVATHFHDRGDHVLAVDVREHETPASEYLQCDLRDAASIGGLLGQIGSGSRRLRQFDDRRSADPTLGPIL